MFADWFWRKPAILLLHFSCQHSLMTNLWQQYIFKFNLVQLHFHKLHVWSPVPETLFQPFLLDFMMNIYHIYIYDIYMTYIWHIYDIYMTYIYIYIIWHIYIYEQLWTWWIIDVFHPEITRMWQMPQASPGRRGSAGGWRRRGFGSLGNMGYAACGYTWPYYTIYTLFQLFPCYLGTWW